jgi:hypothetical protein
MAESTDLERVRLGLGDLDSGRPRGEPGEGDRRRLGGEAEREPWSRLGEGERLARRAGDGERESLLGGERESLLRGERDLRE